MPQPVMGDDGVTTLVGRLVDDSRTLVYAEIALYRARLGERIAAYKSAVVFFVAAAILALAALIALLVGLILALATLVGPLGATAIVVGIVLLMAGVLAVIGKGRLRQPPASEPSA